MGNKEFMRKAIELSVENVKNGGGPFGAVKEQSSGLYAQELAARGFLTVAFDPSYTGESGGTRCVSVPYTGRTSTKYTTVTIRTTQPTSDSTIPLSTKNWLSPVKTARKPWKNCCPKKPSQPSTSGATRQTRLNIKPQSFQSIAAGHPPSCGKSKVLCNGLWIFHYFYPHKKFPYLFHLIREKMFNFADVM